MNRSDMIRMAAHKTGLSIRLCEEVVEAFLECVSLSLAADEEPVNLRAFGKFRQSCRPPTKKKNPATGELMDIPERRTVVFVPSETLKNRVNRD